MLTNWEQCGNSKSGEWGGATPPHHSVPFGGIAYAIGEGSAHCSLSLCAPYCAVRERCGAAVRRVAACCGVQCSYTLPHNPVAYSRKLRSSMGLNGGSKRAQHGAGEGKNNGIKMWS